MIKIKYNKPVTEEFSGLLATTLLDPSLVGDLEDYGEGEDFTW